MFILELISQTSFSYLLSVTGIEEITRITTIDITVIFTHLTMFSGVRKKMTEVVLFCVACFSLLYIWMISVFDKILIL